MIVYQTLKRIGYPIFKPKITSVIGANHLPNAGGFILAANHVDWLDGFYIATAVGLARNVPVHFLTASNNYWWTQVAIQIPSDHRRNIIDVAVRALKRGQVICNFIEGHRNDQPALLPGKTGAVRMAAVAQVPIIPVGITCDSGRTMAQSMRYLLSKKHPVEIAFGSPIMCQPPEGATEPWVSQQTEGVMYAIARLAKKSFR